MIVGVASLYGIIFSLSRMNRLQPNDANKLEKALAVIFGNILLQGINCHKIRFKQFNDHEFRLNDINARISCRMSVHSSSDQVSSDSRSIFRRLLVSVLFCYPNCL
jgi:hypothetical protein